MSLLKRLLGRGDPTAAAASGQTRPTAEALAAEGVSQLIARGTLGAAWRSVNAALATKPQDLELLHLRARVLSAWGRRRDALPAFALAADSGKCSPEFLVDYGWATYMVHGPAAAEPRMRAALALDSACAPAHEALGAMLQMQGRVDQSVAHFRRSNDLNPGSFQALSNLAASLLDSEDLNAAEATARQAVAVAPTHPGAWTNLGVALVRQGRDREALDAYTEATRLDLAGGQAGHAFGNLAAQLRDLGLVDDALALLESRLPHHPDPYSHLTYALLLLQVGRFDEGWRQLEFRWMNEPLASMRTRSKAGVPVWNGQELNGKTLLIRFEQGVGDMIQVLRYAPATKSLGAQVTLVVPTGLEAFARTFYGIDRVVSGSEPAGSVDLQVHLMDLPRVYGARLDNIPADVPYLAADPARRGHWGKRLGSETGLRVGLAWSGNPQHPNDRFRSIPLGLLGDVARVPGIKFFSLQKGSGEEQVDAWPAEVPLVRLGPDLRDFVDTTAVIDQLDLVICVDTAVAHLAGALGKPVWILLPEPSDWRWLRDRCDSPWYPTARLFRQRIRGQWEPLVASVATALAEMVATQTTSNYPSAPASVAPRLLLKPRALESQRGESRPGLSAVANTRVGALQYLPDEPLAGASLERYGEFRQLDVDLLLRVLRPGMTVLEAGAGSAGGFHAVAIADRLGTNGHLYLYENDPIARQIVRQNLALQELRNVTLIQRNLIGAGRGLVTTDVANAAMAQSELGTDTIDDLELDRLELLKIGATAPAGPVLDGADATVWRLRPMLHVATNETDIAQNAARLRDLGYRVWRIDAPFHSQSNYNRRSEGPPGSSSLSLFGVAEEVGIELDLSSHVELL